MSFTSVLQDCHTLATREHARRFKVKQHGFRPRLEALEGRVVLSTLTVTNTLDSGKGSLRYEIAHANKNATIAFDPSLDGQTITLTSDELAITTGLTIQGPGAGQLAISGGKNWRVFDVNASAPVVLSGLTISNGVAHDRTGVHEDDGGGILNFRTLTLSGCVVSGNSIGEIIGLNFGGGIYNAGTLTLTGCTISNDYAGWGSPFFESGEGHGGGIYNAGTLTVSNSTLSGNFATDGGGGICNAGTLTVSTSTFNSNWIDPNGTYTEDNIDGPYTDGGGNTFN
jgi:hypothetical protein